PVKQEGFGDKQSTRPDSRSFQTVLEFLDRADELGCSFFQAFAVPFQPSPAWAGRNTPSSTNVLVHSINIHWTRAKGITPLKPSRILSLVPVDVILSLVHLLCLFTRQLQVHDWLSATMVRRASRIW